MAEHSDATGGGSMGPWPPRNIVVFRSIEAPRVKGTTKLPPNKGLMQTRGPYRNGPLEIKGPYTDKGPLRTKSSYRQGALTDKGLL